MQVEDSDKPLEGAVGKEIMSRIFDVFGSAIDRIPAPQNVECRTIHPTHPQLSERSKKSEIFETGIKAIDVPMA